MLHYKSWAALFMVVTCPDNCSKLQALPMSKVLHRSSVLFGQLSKSHPLRSLTSSISCFCIYVFTHQCYLQAPNNTTSCLQSPYPDANSSAHHLELQSNKWVKQCNISQQSGKIQAICLWEKCFFFFVLQHYTCLSLDNLKALLISFFLFYSEK